MRTVPTPWLQLLPGLALVVWVLLPLAGSGPAAAAPAGQSAALPTTRVPDPRQAGVTWFAATGHTLRGDFLAFWQAHGGLAQFGYPVTEEFAEPNDADGKPYTVQYFERNRFEHHPENSDPQYRVLLGTLGIAFRGADPPVAAQANPAALYFAPTGHSLNGVFKTYWQAHGGLSVNGYPISEPTAEQNPVDGKTYTVQYFERARFELHPENAGTPYEVLLGLLGTQLAHSQGYFGPDRATLGGPGMAWPHPRWGHATNWSWVAGEVILTKIQGGCPYLRYDYRTAVTSSVEVQPVGQAWTQALASGVAANGGFVVVFGHLATAGEPVPLCPGRAFIVDRVQRNGPPVKGPAIGPVPTGTPPVTGSAPGTAP